MAIHAQPGAQESSAGRAAMISTAVTAAGVAAALLLEFILTAIGGALATMQYGGGGLFGGDYATGLLAFGIWIATWVLPVAAGVFVSFWRIVPITAALRPLQVIAWSLVATAVGVTLSFLARVVLSATQALSTSDPMFGNSFPGGLGTARDMLFTLLTDLGSAVSALPGAAPLIVLSGLLLWIWLGHRTTSVRADAGPGLV